MSRDVTVPGEYERNFRKKAFVTIRATEMIHEKDTTT